MSEQKAYYDATGNLRNPDAVVRWTIDLLLPDQTTWYTAWTLDTYDAVAEITRILCRYGQAGPARFQVRRLD